MSSQWGSRPKQSLTLVPKQTPAVGAFGGAARSPGQLRLRNERHLRRRGPPDRSWNAATERAGGITRLSSTGRLSSIIQAYASSLRGRHVCCLVSGGPTETGVQRDYTFMPRVSRGAHTRAFSSTCVLAFRFFFPILWLILYFFLKVRSSAEALPCHPSVCVFLPRSVLLLARCL